MDEGGSLGLDMAKRISLVLKRQIDNSYLSSP